VTIDYCNVTSPYVLKLAHEYEEEEEAILDLSGLTSTGMAVLVGRANKELHLIGRQTACTKKV